MPKATNTHILKTAPSRRAMLTGSGALLAGVTGFLAASGAATAAARPDAELFRLCAEIDALEDKISSFTIKGATLEEGQARDKLARPFADAQGALIAQLCDTPATTIEGIRARARTLLKWAPDWEDQKRSGYHYAMISALLRDLVGEARV